MSTAALPASLSHAAVIQKPLVTRRSIKIAAAALLVAAGSYGVLSESESIATSNAIVSSYVLDVRTPVEGSLSLLPQSAGGHVQKGQLLAVVNNPLFDHQHLDNLRLTEETAQATAGALAVEQRALQSQRDALMLRSSQHTAAMADRLQQQIAESEHALLARENILLQAQTELARVRELYAAGVIPMTQMEKLTFDEKTDAEEVAAHRFRLASLRKQADAISHGVLSEPGTNNDVAYSRQRADEISIKLAEIAGELLTTQAQAREAQITATAEAERNAMRSFSEIRAPGSGLLWKLNAMDGEHAAAGSAILSLVDCSKQFVLAEIPQERLPDVALHGQALIRLAGETTERTGTVVSISGDAKRDPEHKLAASPVENRSHEEATVVVSLDREAGDVAPGSACSVGRTARVRIPTVPSTMIARWMRHSL